MPITPQSPSHDDEEDQQFSEAHTALRRWCDAHPHATFTEIEEAVEAEMQRVRARLVAEAAGEGTAWMQARGTRTRRMTVAGEQAVTLTRTYTVCPVCGTGLFPIDEALALVPGWFAPRLIEGMVRLGT